MNDTKWKIQQEEIDKQMKICECGSDWLVENRDCFASTISYHCFTCNKTVSYQEHFQNVLERIRKNGPWL